MFTQENFTEIFKPLFLKKICGLSLERAIQFAKSDNYTEHSLGINMLLRKYANRYESWAVLIELFQEKNLDDLDRDIVYYLAHIPWHPNIYWHGEKSITVEIRKYAKSLIGNFSELDIVKMIQLSICDNVVSFDNYGTGWNVEALVSLIINKEDKLLILIENDQADEAVQNTLFFLYAHYTGKEGLRRLYRNNLIDDETTQLLELALDF